MTVAIEDHGADPTGKSDSTAAIQAAIAATPRGGTLTMGVGRFVVSDTLRLPQDITLKGEGGNAVWIGPYGPGWDDPRYQSGTVLLSTLTTGFAIDATAVMSQTRLEDFVLIGVGDATRTTTGIRLGQTNAPHFARMRGLRIGNFATALTLFSVMDSQFDDLFIVGCPTGLRCNINTNANTFTNVNVSGSDVAIVMVGAAKNSFRGGAIQGSAKAGVTLRSNAEENSFRDVYFENAAAAWAMDTACDSTVIDSCHFGTAGDAVCITSNGCKIVPGKYRHKLRDTGSGTAMLGDWGN